MAPSPGMLVVQDDPVALAEIELCGELMIAASTTDDERLSFARIDEVLEVARDREPLPVLPVLPVLLVHAVLPDRSN
jgi:hypothetical protein